MSPKKQTVRKQAPKLARTTPRRTKYIFVTGGVISSLGKGTTVAALARLLKSKGYQVSCIKCEMYVNIDAGTIRPTEHGEVFVTKDGIETDQDLGNYERFLDADTLWYHYLTTGQVYQEVIQRERNFEYGGEDVEVVPHVPEEIIRRIKLVARKDRAEIVLIEIGGTVGEYQNVLFLEADRMMKRRTPDDVLNIHVSYLPIPPSVGEMKTKPVQYSVRTLNAAGIQPEFIIGRSERALDKKRKEKISTFCSVPTDHVISNPDVTSIYELPTLFAQQHFGDKIQETLGLPKRKSDLRQWRRLVRTIRTASDELRIGIMGKYFETGDFTLEDSYVSVLEAVKHAAWQLRKKPVIILYDTDDIETNSRHLQTLESCDGIIVPQGWGSRGAEGKIRTIQYLREQRIPYLGLCYGMQMAVVEFARNVAKLKKANSLEVNTRTPHPVIYIMPDQEEYLAKRQYGGTIRVGQWPCKLIKGTKTAEAYGGPRTVKERHRHRYELNNTYRKRLEAKGLVISGTSPDGKLVESIELRDHPFFVGTQFHPEYQSRPLEPHPLFVSFMRACVQRKQLRRSKKREVTKTT